MFSKHQGNSCCAKDESADLAHKAGHKLREIIDVSSEQAHDTAAAIAREVRGHPVQSSAIAAAIGFALGWLLRRR
ncbi:MAG: DUF883 family protein [Pseudomonadota bacterium]|nr:DUF883 family protein [Pseudomonadota bacterium]